jgi:L-lactate dehydrogenase complex protein LldG
MSARDNILAGIRAKLNQSEAAQIDDYLLRHPRGPAPVIVGDIVTQFKQRSLKLSSNVMQAASISDVPKVLAAFLAEQGLQSQGVCWPELASLAWRSAGLDIEALPALDRDLLGITGAYCAIAETGTLMMLSGRLTHARTSLLPETHVAILNLNRIVATMEDAWDLLRKEWRIPPRTVNFISGPSRTADIEQTLTLGAHGPYRVAVILIEDTQ